MNRYPPAAHRPGSRVVLKNDVQEYPLPEGLAAGETVTILAFDHGFYRVEKGGREFVVYMTGIAGTRPGASANDEPIPQRPK